MADKPSAKKNTAASAPKPPFMNPVDSTKVDALESFTPDTVAVAAEASTALAPVIAALPVAEPANTQGKNTMNDTVNTMHDTAQNFTADATARAGEMFGDISGRAKSVMEKSSKGLEDMVEFSKGNLEAVVASSRVAARGAQDIAKYSAEYGRKSIEEATANAKKFAAVKSPTEFFTLQSELAKTSLDALVGEVSKFTEGYMKLVGEVMQPMQNRYAVAVEKVKTTVAA